MAIKQAVCVGLDTLCSASACDYDVRKYAVDDLFVYYLFIRIGERIASNQSLIKLIRDSLGLYLLLAVSSAKSE